MCYYLVMISDSINNASVISVAYLLSNVNRVDLPLTPRVDEYFEVMLNCGAVCAS